MKTINLITLTVVAGSLLTLTARAGLPGIVGSPHDFSSQSWNTDPADPATVCGTCHIAHHADSTVVPLWSHQTTSPGHFTMYNQADVPVSQMKAAVQQVPNGPSLACLSCHDGTVAINTYGGLLANGGSMTTHGTAYYVTNGANLGTDLTHSHPISFSYSPTLAQQDLGLFNPNVSIKTPVSGTFSPGSSSSLSIVNFLLNGDTVNYYVECTTCHDVHNDTGTPFDINSNPHLVKIVGVDSTGKGSLLCRSCHNK